MRLFHEREFPRPAPLSKSDEQECFTAVGRRSGVWLTSEPSAEADAMCFDAPEDRVAEYEVTGPDDDVRAFVVPFGVLTTIAPGPGDRPRAGGQRSI